MSVCKGDFNGYLDYDCYDKLKYQFLEKTSVVTDQNISNFYKSYEFPNTGIKRTLSNIFTDFLRYISNTHVFFQPDKGQSCNYISYLLYHDIQKKEFGECKASTFDIFKNFVQELSSRKINDACVNKLEHLHSEKFQKMLNLYNLYDMYRSVKQKEIWHHRPHLCNELGKLIYNYNHFDANYYKDDLNLRKLLEILKHTIQKNTWVSEDNCPAKLEHMWPLKTFPTENVEPAQMNVKASHLTHSQQVSTSTKSESADVEIRNPSVSELQGQEENLPKQVETLARPERELEEEEVEEDVKLLGEKSQSFPEPLLSFLPKETYEESENALGSGHGTDTMHPLTKPNYPSGFIDKIQYTFSDTLQNIDPVPVVGVSGGMGALFLLFRYTPVGTFFRGRGYRHRIPTRFDGVHPGFMTEFQGYGDGYFPHDRINITYGPE